MNISVATLSYVSLFKLLSIQYQKIHMKYSVNFEGISSLTQTSILSLVFVLCSLKGAAKPWMTNWLVGNDMPILASGTIRISIFPKTASDKSSILFLIEFMLIWVIMTLLRFFIINFFSVFLKLSSKDWQVAETDQLTFLDRLWGISRSLRIAVVFERSDATSEKRFKGCAGSGIKLLMPEHPLTLQTLSIKFKKFLAKWIVPEIFKWSALLPMQWSVMFLLSTTSILSCKRWFVNCLTVKFALALSDRIAGVEKMVWHWGHFSLMKAFSFSSLSKISLQVILLETLYLVFDKY